MMKFSMLYFTLASVGMWQSATGPNLVYKIVLANFALALLGVSIAYAISRPGLLMKRSDGTWHAMGWLVFWPYLIANYLFVTGARILSREQGFNEVAPGLLLGGLIQPWDKKKFRRANPRAVLDLTGEFPEPRSLRGKDAYMCIPLLDTQTPTREQLQAGIEWIHDHAANGSVFIHCAYGHGRSAAFLAAYMLHANPTLSVQEVLEDIRAHRPWIALTTGQRALLHDIAAAR